MEITSSLITPLAEAKILELAYSASKFINLDRADEEIYIGSQIVKLLRSLNDTNSLLGYVDKQQIIQGIIGIGNIKI